jgi:hypothetical protein
MDATGQPCSCARAIAVLPVAGRCAGSLLLGNGIAPLTVLIRKSCIEHVGAFDQRFAPVDDWDLWLRIARVYALGFLDEVTARYRVHDLMVSKDRFHMAQAVLRLMDSICQRFPDIPQSIRRSALARARSRVLMSAADALERSGKVAESRAYWKQAYAMSHDAEALMALLGIPPKWRARAQLRGTTVRRVTEWYLHKLRLAATRLYTSSHR